MMATGTRRSWFGTIDVFGTEMRYTSPRPTYPTMYSAMPALLVVATLNVPSGWTVTLVPPAILRMRPRVMSNCSMRKCLVVKVGLAFALMKSMLWLSKLGRHMTGSWRRTTGSTVPNVPRPQSLAAVEFISHDTDSAQRGCACSRQ
jgi:hypothetical protein